MKVYEIKEFGIDNLSLTEAPEPVPAAGEVVVKFAAASINFRDLMVVEGTYNPKMRLPVVPFSDGAGEISAVGAGVTKWKIGDRVMPYFVQDWTDGQITPEALRTSLGGSNEWNGVLREYAAFGEDRVARVPEHLSFEQAATLPCAALTAWHALVVSGGLKAGETVLTLGSGGVSVFALQIAKRKGAKVISTSSSDEKLARLRSFGADELINYNETPEWEARVLKLTDGRGVDHVVEVGGADTLSHSVASAKMGGHIALIGALSGAGRLDAVRVFMRSLRIDGIYVGSHEMFDQMSEFFASEEIEPVIDKTFAFDEVHEALRYMKNGSHFGKIVVRI